MKRRLLAAAIPLLFLLGLASGASAQTYRFTLGEETVHVYLDNDGALALDYTFTFTNDTAASPIDFVDVGLPSGEYTLSAIRAEVDGQPISDIAASPYVNPGIALGLGEHAIQPGQTGTVRVFIPEVKAQYYPDTAAADYVSFRFSPTWFGSQYVHGETDLTVTFHLPSGVAPAEPRWHEAPDGFPPEPETGFDEDGRITYTWRRPEADGYTQYEFGLSLPRQYVLSVILLEQEVVRVTINPSGTLDVNYALTFKNESKDNLLSQLSLAHPYSYRPREFSAIRADLDGTSLPASAIEAAYQTIHLQLGELSLKPGQRGTVHVAYTLSGEMFSASWYLDKYERARLEFIPATFGKDWLFGTTDMTVAFELPPQVTEQDLHWQAGSGFGDAEVGQGDDGRLSLTWENPAAFPSVKYRFSVDMPRSFIPDSVIYEQPQPDLPTRLGIDKSVFGIGLFAFSVLLFFGLYAYFMRRRKMKYLPPRIAIEGHGIKRGLSPVEAAILMEQPLDKVMTMILFGVIKKGAAKVVKRDPIKLEVAAPLPEGLHAYEREFLQAFQKKSGSGQRKALQKMTVNLIRSVSARMKGFSRRETIAYYKNIMERAWEQIEAADTPEVKSQRFDETLEWTMLDKNYDGRTRRVFTGPVYVPVWWQRYDPAFSRPAAPSPRSSAPRPTTTQGRGLSPSMPQLPGSDFAASVVSSVQTFSQRVIGDLTGFTSKVTSVTNPPPKTSSGGSRSSGGGGGCACACACACAGCACACAGGGR